MVEQVLKEDGTPYKVAILIPTINNADELDTVLNRLTQQTYPDIEIVISDSKSKDHTKDVCEKYGATWIEDPSTNRADACNFALRQMDHDLVLFTDDDTVPPLNWAEKLIRWFKDPEVGAVGGPNFAPIEESDIWQKSIDVAFCNKFLTAGTNYGKKSEGTLEEVEQLPGVNSAYRREVLEEVGGFDRGAIGAEDVMLDHRIRQSGYRLWSDGSATMWHRRRGVGRVRRQIRNYGLVRTLAGKRYPSLWGWSHSLVSAFPILVFFSLVTFIWGCLNGGLSWPTFWDISTDAVPMGIERASVHQLPTLAILFNIIAWFGAILGPSPSKGPLTVIISSMVSFMPVSYTHLTLPTKA